MEIIRYLRSALHRSGILVLRQLPSSFLSAERMIGIVAYILIHHCSDGNSSDQFAEA